MIVYDTTDDHTWKNVEQLWLPLVLEVYQGDLSRGIMIVGTKIDLLSPEEREVVMNRRCSDPKVHSLICQYLLYDLPWSLANPV